MKGAITEMPPEQQRLIQCAATEIQAVLDAYGDEGVIALGLTGLEITIKRSHG